MNKRTVSIIGFGRFGKTLYRLIKDDFDVNIVEKDNPQDIQKSQTLFYCVPISDFAQIIESHKRYFKDDHVIIDVLSVKSHPRNVLQKLIRKTKVQAILSHPMFGPDSSKNGFEGLTWVMWNLNADISIYQFWKNYFLSKKLKVLELSPQRHDQLAANSQGVAHFIGRIIQSFRFKPTEIDTLGAKKLYEIMEQTCNDTWQLFEDLQTYNPYTAKMRLRLGRAYHKVYARLFHKPKSQKTKIYGIQGGKGSFNEQALMLYLNQNQIDQYKVKYLYTTPNVFKNLYLGKIDFGVFALYNNTGGIVEETIREIGKYEFEVIDVIKLPIRHHLMVRQEISIQDVTQIVAHPQVLKQCTKNLENKYSNIQQKSLEGNLIDTAKAAEALSKGHIPPTTAILGPENLATLYNFCVVERDLQDNPNNQTTFLLIKI